MANSKLRSTWGCSLERLERREMLTGNAGVPENWGLDAMDAPEAWSRGATGQGVVVAVIDSGIDPHPDLMKNLWTNTSEKLNATDDDGNGYVNDFNGWDFAEDDNTPITKNRHGNQVLGVIGAVKNDLGTTGVAYNAKIMPLRVFDDAGGSSSRYIADAIRFAVDNGAHIINLSVNGIATKNVESAIRHAADHDVLVVAAAGNSNDSTPSFPASASAHFDNVISVSAHDSDFNRWSHANAAGGQGVVQVEAPGVNVWSTSTSNNYAPTSGTSVAAAHVAGVAALVVSAKPNITADELRNVIVAGATRQVGDSDSVGGVNANRSVDLAIDGTAPSLSSGRNSRGNGTQASGNGADFDNSGEVDFLDFLLLAQNFGTGGKTHAQGDTNNDGIVDFTDFLTFSRAFNQVQLATDAVDAAFEAPGSAKPRVRLA